MQVSASERQIKECTVEKNDIFFTPTSETSEDIGHVMVMEETLPNTCYSYHLMRFRPYQGTFYDLFPNWGFQTRFIRRQMFLAAKGVQRMVMGLSDFENLRVRIPSLDEQTVISSYFGNLDELLGKSEKRLASLKQVKAASLQAMFPQKGEKVPKIRFNGFEGEWEEAALGKLFTERVESDINAEMLSVTMHDGIIKASENGRYDNSNSDRSNYKLVLKDDIAYNSMRMWQGASGCSPYKGIVSPAYTVIIPNKGINSTFFAAYFKTNRLINKFRLHSQGLTTDTWNLKYPAFSVISVLYPTSIEEQQQIAAYFTALDKQIALQTQRLEKLKQIKAACLDKMFV